MCGCCFRHTKAEQCWDCGDIGNISGENESLLHVAGQLFEAEHCLLRCGKGAVDVDVHGRCVVLERDAEGIVRRCPFGGGSIVDYYVGYPDFAVDFVEYTLMDVGSLKSALTVRFETSAMSLWTPRAAVAILKPSWLNLRATAAPMLAPAPRMSMTGVDIFQFLCVE